MSGWTGANVTKARTYWMARIVSAHEAGTPLTCHRCPNPVLPTDTWDVDHVVAREEGGSVLSLTNQWVSHAKCNRADGARRTNAKRAEKAKGLWKW